MHDLRMELYRIEVLGFIFHAGYRAYRCRCCYLEAFRCLLDVIRMAHPADGLRRNAFEELGPRFCNRNLGLAVFTGRRRLHGAAEDMCHELAAVADTEDRHAQLEELCAADSGTLSIYAVRTTRKDNALEIHCFYLVQRECMRMYLTIYIAFSYASGNQLVILAAKVQYQNHFIVLAAQFIVPPKSYL